jgi:nucleoside-diphosphate-sugar epimerase
MYAANTVGTSSLLEAVARTLPEVRKVLPASSAHVYGDADADPIDENVPPMPVNHCACSKLAMEPIARTWVDRLPIVIARPFNYTGPGQTEGFLIPKLEAHYAGRRPVLEPGNIEVERDFSDVRMVADAYARLLGSDATGVVVTSARAPAAACGRPSSRCRRSRATGRSCTSPRTWCTEPRCTGWPGPTRGCEA